jgi:hypothetical protein
MRCQAIIILLAFALSIIIPQTLPIINTVGKYEEINTLDICHSATPAISSSRDMPCLNEFALSQPPVSQSVAAIIMVTPLKRALLVFQLEHPPKT